MVINEEKKVSLEFFYGFADIEAGTVELPCPEPTSLESLLKSLKMDMSAVSIILRDSKSITLETYVQPGEHISLYPILEGG